jgi:hypothetical protein
MAASNIFAGAGQWRGGKMSGLFRHTPGADGFEQLKRGLPDPVSVQAITPHPLIPGLIFAGTQDGPYRSTDGGDHWERTDFPDRNVQIWSILVHPRQRQTIFAGASPVAVYRSDDGGEKWRLLARPALTERVKMNFGCRVMRMAIDPERPNDLYAIVEVNGVMRSRDGGESWSDCSAGLLRLAQEPRYKSDLGSGNDAEGMLDGHALCVTSADPGAVFLALRMGLFRSPDGGETWADMGVGKFSALTYARDIRVSAQDPSTLYSCLSVHSTGDTGSLCVSRDLGRSWKRIDHGIKVGGTIMGLTLHPSDPNQVYGISRNGQVIGTTDGGASWQEHRLPQGCADCYAVACA